jgi:hypothetical protein
MSEPLGRMELFARLGRIAVAETMLNQAVKAQAEREWRNRIDDSPHGGTWFSSMHVSSFPGDDPRACERQLLYEMMGFAHSEVLPQRVYSAGAMGIGIERWETDLFEFDGRLLSAGNSAKHGVGFEDADHWLTGSPDLVVLPKFWNRPLVIECKGDKLERVEEMRSFKRSYWPKHARQCRGYVGMGARVSREIWPAAVVCRHTWRLALPGEEPFIEAMICPDHGIHSDTRCLREIELQPINSGVLLYSARDNPEVRASYYFEHDEQWFQQGLATLRRVQEHYVKDELPPHPFGGKQWSAPPCNYCNHKRSTCKPDHQAGTTKLSESHGVEWSQEVFGHYNPQWIRQQVLERWRGREGYSYTLPPGYEAGRYGIQKSDMLVNR